MSFSVGFIMVLASAWIAYLASFYPRHGVAWRLCRSSPPLWGGYVAAILCLVYSAGMALSDLLAYGWVSFWLGFNLVYSCCFWVVPAAVAVSALLGTLPKRNKQLHPASRPWLAKPITIISLHLLAIAFYASLYEPNAVRLSTVHLASSKLPQGSELRLLHLSDLHISKVGMRENRALRLAQAARPDLILLTGDYLSSAIAAPQARQFLSRLRAPLGVFAVAGAADEHINLSNTLEETHVRLLRDEALDTQVRGIPLRVVGLTWDKPNLQHAFPSANPNVFTIFLSHSPRIFLSRPPADLLLAGQSHGGQVGIPAFRSLIITYLRGDPRYFAGLFRRGNLTMYVSRGLGMQGGDAPRIRFLAPPEVTLIIVKGQGRGIRH